MSKGHALSKLHIPYDRGEKTNYTFSGHATVATEIDYIMVSKHIGVAQKGVYPGVSTHMALVCTLTGMGCQPVTVQKRYKHRVITEDQKQRAARLLALYWWWLAGTGAHPDAWVACYWSIADGILPPSSNRVSAQAILDREKGLVNQGGTQRELRAWHKKVQQHLYVRGVRMNDQVLSTVSISSHTTRAIQPTTKAPRPYPQLKSRADQRQEVQEALRTAGSQLEFYHITRGQSVNVSVLVHDGLLQPEFAGVGIVVTDGIECQEFSFGVVAAAVSSSALEWLAKLLAMLLLQHCRGELYMFCDNASVQVSAHSTIVTTQSWVDRLARKLLQLPVFSKVREC